jgi:hypothetical protein
LLAACLLACLQCSAPQRTTVRECEHIFVTAALARSCCAPTQLSAESIGLSQQHGCVLCPSVARRMSPWPDEPCNTESRKKWKAFRMSFWVSAYSRDANQSLSSFPSLLQTHLLLSSSNQIPRNATFPR